MSPTQTQPNTSTLNGASLTESPSTLPSSAPLEAKLVDNLAVKQQAPGVQTQAVPNNPIADSGFQPSLGAPEPAAQPNEQTLNNVSQAVHQQTTAQPIKSLPVIQTISALVICAILCGL